MNSLSNAPGVAFLTTAGEGLVLVLVVCAVASVIGAITVRVVPADLRWRDDLATERWRTRWCVGLLLFAAFCSVMAALVKVSLEN
jgi:hypothetical protein